MNSLSVIIFLPLITAVLLFFIRINITAVKAIYMIVTSIIALLTIKLYIDFEQSAQIQFTQMYSWISEYGINYHIGVDGVSLGIVMMNALLMPLVAFALYKQRDQYGYWVNLLFVQGGIMGVALSLDLMLFYLFWEIMLLPIFFMIGLFGYGKKNFITMKFNMYTIFGSLMMLISILYVAVQYKLQFGVYSFDINLLKNLALTQTQSLLVFSGFMIAFAIKIPIFPFHTWLVETYKAAPTGAIIVMSALMAKLGTYAIWRVLFTILNKTSHDLSQYFIALGLFGLIFFGISAMRQNNIKQMFAYSSASHLSLIVVGFFIFDVYGLIGASYLIVSHSLSSAALFLMVGMLHTRARTDSIRKLGGIARVAPRFALFFAFFGLSIVGIPTTAGFVAELLIILGAFNYNFYIGFIAATSILIAMLFMFTVMSKVLYGETTKSTKDFEDLQSHELLALIPLALLVLAMGIFPNYFIKNIEPTAISYTTQKVISHDK
jgi:NADH-quinone oxidoreductase subunit M